MCVQTVGLLAHAIEGSGIPTVVISLLEPVTRILHPPRALEVPFAFGRPLGAAGDPVLQRRVLASAMALLGRVDVPVHAPLDRPQGRPG
jgi:hypothetical protein